MSTYIHCLTNPEKYNEKDVQLAVEHLWPCLFDYYEILTKTIKMPHTWQPDIVAEHYDWEKEGYLIIEVKTSPPSGLRNNAINQVVRYGKELHERYPYIPVRLMVLAPYKQKNIWEHVECDKYIVTVVNIKEVGRRLLDLAEGFLFWHTKNPIYALDDKPISFTRLERMVLEKEPQRLSNYKKKPDL